MGDQRKQPQRRRGAAAPKKKAAKRSLSDVAGDALQRIGDRCRAKYGDGRSLSDCLASLPLPTAQKIFTALRDGWATGEIRRFEDVQPFLARQEELGRELSHEELQESYSDAKRISALARLEAEIQGIQEELVQIATSISPQLVLLLGPVAGQRVGDVLAGSPSTELREAIYTDVERQIPWGSKPRRNDHLLPRAQKAADEEWQEYKVSLEKSPGYQKLSHGERCKARRRLRMDTRRWFKRHAGPQFRIQARLEQELRERLPDEFKAGKEFRLGPPTDLECVRLARAEIWERALRDWLGDWPFERTRICALPGPGAKRWIRKRRRRKGYTVDLSFVVRPFHQLLVEEIGIYPGSRSSALARDIRDLSLGVSVGLFPDHPPTVERFRDAGDSATRGVRPRSKRRAAPAQH